MQLSRGGSLMGVGSGVSWQELVPEDTWREVVLWAKFKQRTPEDLMAEAWTRYYEGWKQEQA